MDESKQFKCYECVYFNKTSYMKGYGDCGNKKVRGSEIPLIWLHYCDDFAISENFGCIYGDKNPDIALDTQEQRKGKGAIRCSCGVYCATDKEGE